MMSNLKRGVILIFTLIVLVQTAFAGQGHIKLLAVTEVENGFKGTSADLYLEIKPGTGRVFLDTFPFTKFDTQMSTRFAKDVACKFINADCSQYDFFYTIRADSAIVGGPSAGAAIAVLTAAMVDDTKIDESITITGTINSGGLIGPIGGIKEKVEIAPELGLKKIIIPSSSLTIKEGEQTINLKEYAKTLKIEVADVSDLGEALYIFTGKRYKENNHVLSVNEDYKRIMKELADDLCSESKDLISRYALINKTDPLFENARNLSKKGDMTYRDERYYSAASYCFGSGAQLQFLMLKSYQLTGKEIVGLIENTNSKIKLFDYELDQKKYDSITSLETYAVVKERLIQANDHLIKSKEFLEQNKTEDSIYNLAFAIERLKSAKLWGKFYDLESKKFQLNKEVVKKSCLDKISEAEERVSYVDLYLPASLEDTKKELGRANADSEEGNYELCLFKAAKAKAEADIVLNVFNVEDDKVKDILKQKLEIVKRNIIIETEKGIFPILGYSYFEYAQSLMENDPFSGMLYAEYALELSNLDMYFEKGTESKIKKIQFKDLAKICYAVLVGVIIGILVTKAIAKKKAKNKAKASRKIKR